MNIPLTFNAYAVSLAELGHHVYSGAEVGQVTDNLPIDGLQAFISANYEHGSVEATFLIPGLVADEMTALAAISALQQSATGLCRFIVENGHVQAKASLLVGEFLKASHVQSWWRRSLEEVGQWYRTVRNYSIVIDGDAPPVPEHLRLRGQVLDIFSGEPRPDSQICAAVTAERVAACMEHLTSSKPQIRSAGGSRMVEASIGGQALDIEITESELRFIIGSSMSNQNPSLSTVLAQTINQLHNLEPAPAAFVLDSGEHIELYTRAVVDTTVGLDEQALQAAIQKWGPYVYDFNERIFTHLRG